MTNFLYGYICSTYPSIYMSIVVAHIIVLHEYNCSTCHNYMNIVVAHIIYMNIVVAHVIVFI